MKMDDQDNMRNPMDDTGEEMSEGTSSPEDSFVTAPKKPINRSAMVLFGILMLGGCCTYFMYLHSGPNSTNASPSAETVAAQETINQFLGSGGENMKRMHEMLQGTQKVVQQFITYPCMKQVPLSDLKTNPFSYPKLAGAVDNSGKDNGNKRSREAERNAILQTAQQMQLQTVMHSGATRTCMINNAMYQEGQQVQGFTVERIASQSVIVRNGSYRFELRMQK